MMRRGPAYGGAPVPPVHRGPMPPRPPPPHLNPVSNVTNSSDFASKDSRVFVGNLNTFALSKEDVDRIFGHYGLVTGISMHKGYAFVQYGHPGEARRAVAFENGNSYGGQILDLNVVSEPKKGGQKRSIGPGMNDRSVVAPRRPMHQQHQHHPQHPQHSCSPTMPQAAKRARHDSTPPSNPSMQRSNLVTLSNSSDAPLHPRPRPMSTPHTAARAAVKRAATTVTRAAAAAAAAAAATASSVSQSPAVAVSTGGTVAPGKDVLICGVCKMQFTSLHSLAQHKKIPCRLRTSCQCQTNPPKPPPEEKELECATCDARFDSAWALCQHCHKEHNMSIFKTTDGGSNANSASGTKAGTKEAAEEKNGQESSDGAKKPQTETTSSAKK